MRGPMQPGTLAERHRGYQAAEEVAVGKQREAGQALVQHVRHAKVLIAWFTRRLARV